MSRTIIKKHEDGHIKQIMVVSGCFDEKIYEEQIALGKSHEDAYIMAGGYPMPEGMDNYFTENWQPYRNIDNTIDKDGE